MTTHKRFAGWALLAACMGHTAFGQPALTTVQDILYLANGTRFNGTMFITWSSFLSGGGANIATANLTVPIVNGVLNVQLVPTTDASAGAQYNITYNSNGVNLFTEVWAVPPSSSPLAVSGVRVSSGTIVGPQPVTTAITIAEVTGLQNELNVRPVEDAAFTPGRAAIIDDAGMLGAAVGNLSDCVRVDGSAGPCGSSSSGILPGYSDAEIPSGTINGVNTQFTLMAAPSPSASLQLFLNGLLMESGIDYQLAGNEMTMAVAPQPGDILLANYRYGSASNPLGSLTAAQVVCSTTGSSTTGATLASLGTCTMPAGLLGTGDRLEIQFQYGHTGSANGFTGEIQIGGATVLSRNAAAGESALAGRVSFGLYSGGQQWDTQSWGGTLAFQTAAGMTSQNTNQSLTVVFLGNMAASGNDSVVLNNFTVIRYPAQVNP